MSLVVVSGLAASGKTTVGRGLAERLVLPLIDKDDVLEGLFDSLGCEDREQRHRLSRAADEVLFRLAATATTGAVLVNWWDHNTAPARLSALGHGLVEVFCDCPIEVAAARFAERRRHPGHLDHLRTPEEHAEGIARMRTSFRGPLRIGGDPVVVDTAEPVDLDALAARVALRLSAGPRPRRTESGRR